MLAPYHIGASVRKCAPRVNVLPEDEVPGGPDGRWTTESGMALRERGYSGCSGRCNPFMLSHPVVHRALPDLQRMKHWYHVTVPSVPLSLFIPRVYGVRVTKTFHAVQTTRMREGSYEIRALLRDNLDENGGSNQSLKRRPVAKV